MENNQRIIDLLNQKRKALEEVKSRHKEYDEARRKAYKIKTKLTEACPHIFYVYRANNDSKKPTKEFQAECVICEKRKIGKTSELCRPQYLYKITEAGIKSVDMEFYQAQGLFIDIFNSLLDNNIEAEKIVPYTQLIILSDCVNINEIYDSLTEEELKFIESHKIENQEKIKRMT